MAKYLVLLDDTRIPIDEVSTQSPVICYPEDFTQLEAWWDKLTPETTAKQISVDMDGHETVIYEDPYMHFNKIELERCSTGLLMRIYFATPLEEEVQRLLAENAILREDSEAYHIMRDGGSAV